MKQSSIGRTPKIVFFSLVLLICFAIGNRLSEFVRTSLQNGKSLNYLTGNIAQAFAGNVFHISFAQLDLLVGAFTVLLILLVTFYNLSGKQNRRPGEEQGSASWGQPKDIAPLMTKDPGNNIRFTQTEALNIDGRKTLRNLNVCVIGAAGTGKTRGYLMPNLRTVRMSKAVTDPKGEIYRQSADELRAAGYNVRVFNLVDPIESGHFNPFCYFDPKRPEVSIAQLTEGIIANTTSPTASGDGFWDRAERALLNALIAYTWATRSGTDGAEPSLVDVSNLHKEMSAAEGADADRHQSKVDLQFQAANELVAEYYANPDASVDPVVMNVLDFACRQYRTFEQGAGETKKSIIISLGVRLAPLDISDIRSIIADDDLAIDTIGYEPTVLFLAIPDTQQTFRFLAAMFWQALFEKNVYLADHEPTGHLPIPVHCFLDEFPNIGKIPNFPILIATIRSRGISTSVIVQSYKQGQALWKDDWPTIVANCDSILFLGGRDMDTLKWLSALIGDETVIVEDTSRSYGVNGSYTRSQRSMKRALMTPDELGKMSNDLAILLIRGLRPFQSLKVRL